MITIIYPFGDYTAADMAIKMQALASVQNKPIYVVPKHFGRKDEKVEKKLSETKIALLLVADKKTLDKKTKLEIDFLIHLDVPIYAFIPNYLEIQNKKIKAYKYDPKNKNDLYQQLSIFFKNLEINESNNTSDWFDLLVAIGTIAAGLLLLSILLNDKN